MLYFALYGEAAESTIHNLCEAILVNGVAKWLNWTMQDKAIGVCYKIQFEMN